MSGVEIAFAAVGLVGVVAQLVSAYRDGGGIVSRIKARRAERQAPPLLSQLEHGIARAPADLEREKQNGIEQFGSRYEEGDPVVMMMIQQVTIQVQGSFLARLHNALDNDTDFTPLVDDMNRFRIYQMKALYDFQSRLLSAEAGSAMPWEAPGPALGLGLTPRQEPRMARITPPAPSTARPLIEPDSFPRHDSFTGSPPQPSRQHTFGLFGKNKRSSKTRKGSEELTEVDSLGFRRVVTLPSDGIGDKATTGQPEPSSRDIVTPPVPQPRTRQANDQSAPPAPSAASPRTQSSLPPRQSASPRSNVSNEHEPWLNESEVWGQQDARMPRASIAAPVQHRSSIPQATQIPRSVSMSLPVRTTTTQSGSSTSSGARPYPNKSNNYLGFCKGACKMQDRSKETMKEAKDWTQANVSSLKFLECADCRFQGHHDLKTIWTMIAIRASSMKIRWSFLAKSHVQQRNMLRREEAKKDMFCYQCIFCVFTGYSPGVFQGAKNLMSHVHWQHYGQVLDDVVLYKAGCVNGRIAEDDEEFDINIYPRFENLDE